MERADILIVITADMYALGLSYIRTNARPEEVGEFLKAWVTDQIVAHKHEYPPFVPTDEEDVGAYVIKLGFDLVNPAVGIASDTGDKCVTLGIVCTMIDMLSDIKILPLNGTPA